MAVVMAMLCVEGTVHGWLASTGLKPPTIVYLLAAIAMTLTGNHCDNILPTLVAFRWPGEEIQCGSVLGSIV